MSTWASFWGLTIFVILCQLSFVSAFLSSGFLWPFSNNNLDNSIICMTEKCSLNTLKWMPMPLSSENADIKEKAIEFEHKLYSIRATVQNVDLICWAELPVRKAVAVAINTVIFELLSIQINGNLHWIIIRKELFNICITYNSW